MKKRKRYFFIGSPVLTTSSSPINYFLQNILGKIWMWFGKFLYLCSRLEFPEMGNFLRKGN